MSRTLLALRRSRPPEVLALTAMCLLSSAFALGAAASPMTPEAPTGVNATAGAVGLGLAAMVWSRPHRVVLHLAVAAHVLAIGALVARAATGVGAAGAMLGCVWVALYAAFFLGRRSARGCSTAVAAVLGAALVVNPFVGAAQLWLLVSVTTVLATEVVGAVVARLARSAVTDPLTGALNRKGLHEAAAPALRRAGRGGSALTVVALDLDGFKAVNDRDGHAAGDHLLVDLVASWRRGLRAGDVLARQGGDEFVLMLADTDRIAAEHLLDRLRLLSPTGWSAGVAAHEPGDTLDSLLLRADRALYLAKAGRHHAPSIPAQRHPGRATAAPG